AASLLPAVAVMPLHCACEWWFRPLHHAASAAPSPFAGGICRVSAGETAAPATSRPVAIPTAP
ncbi:MAG TPA: hypothetical protein VJ890_18370, partial [Vineibacter sp.]|nr:hypothetical protein [Vineibacter sp.]